MQRVPEPELMDDPEQAAAYAAADFSDPHGMFITKFREIFHGRKITGPVLDLGCGPADISIRFAQAYPACHIYGVDGSQAMLREGRAALARAGLQDRIELIQGVIPELEPPRANYQVIMSNSLLHHLHQPQVLWQYIKKLATGKTLVYVMDLMRPQSIRTANKLVNIYCEGEPEILRNDFFNSLCAAFVPQEVKFQLEAGGLPELTVAVISDRHLLIYGESQNAQKECA